MRIIVCVKQIAHTFSRTGMDPDRNYLVAEDTLYRVNPCDEVAVEMALRARDSSGAGEVILLSLGPRIAEGELRRCLAMGADRLICVDAVEGLDSWNKAGVLAECCRRLEADLVLCGKESLDTRNGQVGHFLAHHLDLPYVGAVIDLEVFSGREVLNARRSAGRGVRQVISCVLPVVLGVDVGGVDPRIPNYRQRRAARDCSLETLTPERTPGVPKVVRERIFAPRPRPRRIPVPDSHLPAHERIECLLAGSRVEKKGQLLTGDPESQVEGIVSFLKERGFLPTA